MCMCVCVHMFYTGPVCTVPVCMSIVGECVCVCVGGGIQCRQLEVLKLLLLQRGLSSEELDKEA